VFICVKIKQDLKIYANFCHNEISNNHKLSYPFFRIAFHLLFSIQQIPIISDQNGLNKKAFSSPLPRFLAFLPFMPRSDTNNSAKHNNAHSDDTGTPATTVAH
jgi:hypothetical protein